MKKTLAIEKEQCFPEGRRPTIQDVADTLGMHKSTISLALSGHSNISEHTRARVITAVRQLGYEPDPLAQRLAKGHRSPSIYILSGTLDVGLATEKILLIQKGLGGQSFDIPIYTCSEPTSEAAKSQIAQVRQLIGQRPRAIICAAQHIDPFCIQQLEAYQKMGGIVVSYDIPIPLDCDQVIFDREDNAYQAARFLLSQGHRKIGINLAQFDNLNSDASPTPNAFRLSGFLRALQDYETPIHDDWFLQTASYERGGSALAQRFLALHERPTAMCIINDYVALAFMTEVMRAGVRVPQDLSLVGHDNQPIASYCPVPLTSVTQPTEEIAQAVIAMAQERLNGSHAPPQKVVIRGKFIERDSVHSTF